MAMLAKVCIIVTLSSAAASASSCESGSCVEDETSFVQMKQTLRHGSERSVDDEDQEAAARIAGAKMEYWRSLIEQDLVMEQFAASKAWVDAGIATSKEELQTIENARSRQHETSNRKEKALELVWKGQIEDVATLDIADEKQAKAKKKAETHAEKAMVHQLALLFVADGKKRAEQGKAAIERITARDKLMDQAAAVAGSTNLDAFVRKADAQLGEEESAIMKKSHANKEFQPSAGQQDFDLRHDHQESLMQVETGVTPDEVFQQKPDQDIALDAVGVLASEARKTYYGEETEAHLKLASAKMMYKKALIEGKLKIREYAGSEARTLDKLKKQQQMLTGFEHKRKHDLAKAMKKSKLAQAAWEGEAARLFLLKEKEIPAEMTKEAEASAREIVTKKLKQEQKANYLQLMAKRSRSEKGAKKAIETYEDQRQKKWPTIWKDLLDEVQVLVGVKERLIKGQTKKGEQEPDESWEGLMEKFKKDEQLEKK